MTYTYISHRDGASATTLACFRTAAAATWSWIWRGEMELRRLTGAIPIAILIAGFAMAAKGETNLITKAGVWQAFGGTTSSGRPVCGVSQSAGDRYFGVKFYAGDTTFTIQVGKKAWRFENGANQKLQMTLDGNRPWTATGTGMHFNDGEAGLEFTISRNELDQFASEFRTSSSLRVQLTGPEPEEWSISLAGSNAVTDAFIECIIGLK